jgi:hypothetical protein
MLEGGLSFARKSAMRNLAIKYFGNKRPSRFPHVELLS